MAAGLDLEMPSSGGVTDREIVRAVRAGRLDEAALDALCARVLRLALAHAPQRKKAYPAPVHNVAAVRRMLDRHHALAVRAARESAVLLKNEQACCRWRRTRRWRSSARWRQALPVSGRGSSLINAHGRRISCTRWCAAAAETPRMRPAMTRTANAWTQSWRKRR